MLANGRPVRVFQYIHGLRLSRPRIQLLARRLLLARLRLKAVPWLALRGLRWEQDVLPALWDAWHPHCCREVRSL